MHRNTKSCRFSHAHTLTISSLSFSNIIFFQSMSILMTSPSKSFTKMVLAPDHKKYFLFFTYTGLSTKSIIS